MRPRMWKLLGVAVVVVAIGVLIGFYVAKLTTEAGSPSYTVPVQTANGHPVVDLTIETVAAVGPQLSPAHPGLRLVPDPQHEGTVGAATRSGSCRRTRPCT